MSPTADSPSSSSASSATTTTASSHPIPTPSSATWWESLSAARSRIHSLSSLLSLPHLASLADSDRPARSLLDSSAAYSALSAALSLPLSGSGDDSLCHWLYDTFLSPDPDIRLVVLSFLPLISSLYLTRVLSPDPPSLAGFEAVLLAVYGTEVHARQGKPVLVSVPNLSQPSLYHSPRPQPRPPAPAQPQIGILSPPLEPHRSVKSTKRACIVAVALDCYYKKISLMPPRSKLDLCEFVASWAGQDCPCRFEFDNDSSLSEIEVGIGRLGIEHCNGDSASPRGVRVPLPWELLQPVLRILGHSLLAPLNPQEVRDAASTAVRCVYARAMHDLLPQAILATRSLIQLDKSARSAVKVEVGLGGSSSNPTTPSKPKKPEDWRRRSRRICII